MDLICGIISPRHAVPAERRRIMAQSFAERGLTEAGFCACPDGWNDPGDILFASFAWPRPDREGRSASPLCDEDMGLAIAADCRIDDRERLARELGLEIALLPFGSRHDQDRFLILKAYEKWGEQCADHLLGDFAFVIFDSRNKTAFAARDHMGVRPFFYYEKDGEFVFASNVNAILALHPELGELDEQHLAACLTFGNHHSHTDTFFRRIRKLPAGHRLKLDRSGHSVSRYWHPRQVAPISYATHAEYEEKLLDLLRRAVADRVDRQGDIGVHITGGLDSSTIATLALEACSQRGTSLTRGYCWQPAANPGEPLSNEHRWIKRITDYLQIDVAHITADVDTLEALYRRDCTTQPCDKTLLNELPVQREAAADGVATMLSGWGGDQIISNGGKLSPTSVSGKFRQSLKRLIDPQLVRKLVDNAGLRKGTGVTAQILKKVLPEYRLREASTEHVDKDFLRRIDLPDASLPDDKLTVRETQLWHLENGTMTRRIEEWAGSGQEFGIEYSYPLLDRRIIEFALAIPAGQYRQGAKQRWIFRRTLSHIAPHDLCWSNTKREIVRVGALEGPFVAMTRRLAAMLKSGRIKPERAKYVDIDALIATIEDENFAENGRFGPTQTALRILDFPDGRMDAS